MSVNKNLLFAFCIMTVFYELGISFQFGTFYATLLDKFQSGRARTAAVQSLVTGLTLGLGVVSGFLVTKVGIHWVMMLSCILVPGGFIASFFATRLEHLYVTIGIISGFGISITYVTSILLVSRIFANKRRDLCLSLLIAFSSLSGLVYPYLIDWLVLQFGLHGSFLILGAVFCNKFPMILMVWANRTSIDKQLHITNDKENGATSHVCSNLLTKLRENINAAYIFLLLGFALTISVIIGYFGLLLDVSEWKGFSRNSWRGLFILVIYNAASTISRIIPGLARQLNGVNPFIFPIISSIAGFIGQFILYTGSSYAMFALSVSLSGIAIGGCLSSQHILLLKVVREEFLPIGSGLLITSTGVFNVAMGPLFGSIRDNSGSYDSVILTMSVLLVTAIVFFTIVLFKTCFSDANRQRTGTISVYTISHSTQN